LKKIKNIKGLQRQKGKTAVKEGEKQKLRKG
jgi:hypothetical protein